MNKKESSAIIIFILILAGLLIWGVVGAIASQDSGVTCDTGVGNVLCWRWHTNALGEVQEFIDDLRGT